MLNMFAAEIPEYSNAFVVLMGVGTVFVGLVLIILVCKIMGFAVGKSIDTVKTVSPATTTAPVQSNTQTSTVIENKGELVAAISAAVAENLGRDVEAIRIVSIKKV